MMSIILLVLISVISSVTAAPFLAHSKAVIAGDAGEHERAQKLLQEALVATPYDAALLYDAGVAEFKCGNYAPAASYFEKAAQYTEKPALQYEALFNAGNAHAHLKEYDAALQNYEKILSHDVTHERAKHNYEVVKKLKEQEEQQQQEQDENQHDKKDKQDQENKEDNQDNQDSDKGDDNRNHEDGDQSDEQKQQQQQQQEENNKNNSSSSVSSDDQKSSDEIEQQQQGNDKQQKESPTHGDQSPHTQERDYNKQHEEPGNAHNKPSEKAEKKESAQAQSSNSAHSAQLSSNPEQPLQIPEALEGPDKQWMRCALEACDKQDTTHNKQLLKAMVGADKGDRRAVRSSW